jgi:hypothetical protein
MVVFSKSGSAQRSSPDGVAAVSGKAVVDAEVPGDAILVDVSVTSGGFVVMRAAMVDVSVEDEAAVPVCKSPRRLPAATETKMNNRRTCVMPTTESF